MDRPPQFSLATLIIALVIGPPLVAGCLFCGGALFTEEVGVAEFGPPDEVVPLSEINGIVLLRRALPSILILLAVIVSIVLLVWRHRKP